MTFEEKAKKEFERRIKALGGYVDDCKDAKTVKIVSIAKPTIRSYDGTIQHEVDE